MGEGYVVEGQLKSPPSWRVLLLEGLLVKTVNDGDIARLVVPSKDLYVIKIEDFMAQKKNGL
jgi:hypothetical protein